MHGVKYWGNLPYPIAAALASLVFAEDFKTIKGKEYKIATVPALNQRALF